MGIARTDAGVELGGEGERQIIESITEQFPEDPLTLPPLHEAIDIDALTGVLNSDGLTEVRFEYYGHEVIVEGPDEVSVRER